MLPLTKEELKSYQHAKVCRKRFLKTFNNDKNYQKVRDLSHFKGKCRCAAQNVRNLRFNAPNKIQVFFHNGSNYDYYFIIKELVNEFEGQFECLGKHTEKYKTSSVSIEKEVTNVNNNYVNEKVVSKMKFIDGARFMAS